MSTSNFPAPRKSARVWIVPAVAAAGVSLFVLTSLTLQLCCTPLDAAPPQARDYPQSEIAAKVEGLLDRKAYSAAEGIFNAKLPEHADDAGLHVQYARYLILTRSPHSPGYLRTPLMPDGEQYQGMGVAIEAGNRATQLDPEVKHRFAFVVLTALRDRVDQELEADSGVISTPSLSEVFSGLRTGFSTSMLQVAWPALEASPETARTFADDFRALKEKAVEKGKISSAAMLGNLTGDLEQGGVEGERDFDMACDAFLRALANYQRKENDVDWIAENVRIYEDLWGKHELAKARRGEGPPSFDRLEQELKSRGYSLVEKEASP
ncbi:MAG: hypothetical protein RIC55_24075 [Pirellulaceae bacterium]